MKQKYFRHKGWVLQNLVNDLYNAVQLRNQYKLLIGFLWAAGSFLKSESEIPVMILN